MDNTIVGAGIVTILAAIVGGGLKGFGFDLPVIDFVGRQIALGAKYGHLEARSCQVLPRVMILVADRPPSMLLKHALTLLLGNAHRGDGALLEAECDE